MKTIAWGNVPNNIRCWAAAQVMANDVEMNQKGSLTILTMSVPRALIDVARPTNSVNNRITQAVAKCTPKKLMWFSVMTGLKDTGTHLQMVVAIQNPGLPSKLFRAILGEIAFRFRVTPEIEEFGFNEIGGVDMRLKFANIEDEGSMVNTTRELSKMATHQIHVEIAKENAAAAQEYQVEQIEMPFELSEEANVEPTKMEEACNTPLKPTIKDNWIVGWRLIGTSIKQALFTAYTRLTFGKSFTH